MSAASYPRPPLPDDVRAVQEQEQIEALGFSEYDFADSIKARRPGI